MTVDGQQTTRHMCFVFGTQAKTTKNSSKMNLKSYLQMIAIDDSYDTLLGCFLNKYKHASKVIRNFKLI